MYFHLLSFYIILIICFFNISLCNNDIISDNTIESTRSSFISSVIPFSYIIEHNIPENNIIQVNKTYEIKIWPKNEQGENITVEGSQITILPKPLSSFNVKRIDTINDRVLTLEFTLIEAENPCIIYLIENKKPIAPGIKFAAIDGKKIDFINSKLMVDDISAKIGENLRLSIELLDAFGNPTLEGADQIKFTSSVDINKLGIQRIEREEDSSILTFNLNCTEVGNYDLSVTYRGKNITGSPTYFSFIPGDICNKNSKIMGFGSWICEINKANTFYIQLLDNKGNEIITVPTLTSKQYENTNKDEEDNNENINELEEQIQELSNTISLIAWNGKKQKIETFEYISEYLGKSTWGIKYTLNLDQLEKIYLGIYYEDNIEPIGGSLLPIYTQESGFPYPPNTYQMLGPYPARPELLESAPSTISVHPTHMKKYTLDKNGWLSIFYSSLSISDTDYRTEMIGNFHVEETGIYLLICQGVEHYNIDVPILYSGDVWNIHELKEGYHSLQVSLLEKRDWNYEFQCRFQKFSPLKSYSADSIIPDIIDSKLMGNIQVLLQNLNVIPISDLEVKVIAINTTDVYPIASFNGNSILYPQELTRLSIKLDFSTEKSYNYPKEDFYMVLGFYSETMQSITRIPLVIRVRNTNQPFVFTFTDFDSTIQSAIAIKPINPCSNCPIILLSHSGSVPIKTLSEYLPPQENAWWLIPNGRTVIPYELGPIFEKHSMTCIDKLVYFIEEYHELFSNYNANKDFILSIGSHHYGGKGALLLANHYPDRMMGVATDSGWIKHSIPRTDDFIHPIISGLISWSNIHEDVSHTLSNLRYVPILAGTGSGDTNGYPWRLFYQQTLFDKENVEVRADTAVGPSYKSHITSAITLTSDVLHFIEQRITKGKMLPKKFTVSSSNPGVYHGRGGVYISALINPINIATIDVEIDDKLWILNTSNTLAFELFDIKTVPRASQILIDGKYSFMIDTTDSARFYLNSEGRWKEQTSDISFRKSNHYGPVSKLYEDKLTIVCGTNTTTEIMHIYQLFSVYISKELYKQHKIQARIIPDEQYLLLDEKEKTNVFLIGGPQSNIVTKDLMNNTSIPISYNNGMLSFAGCTIDCNNEIAAMFLAPYNNHLAFVVSASSFPLMQSITHILPLHTAYDQFPDYVILDKDHTWKGGNAIISTGYWDANWNYNPLSAYHNCPTNTLLSSKCDTLW